MVFRDVTTAVFSVDSSFEIMTSCRLKLSMKNQVSAPTWPTMGFELQAMVDRHPAGQF
jgi:hypothetical protein